MFRAKFLIILVSINLLHYSGTVDAASCSPDFPTPLPNGNCIFVSRDIASYCNAQKSCEQRNGELLTGESQIASVVNMTSLLKAYWIGLTNLYPSSNYKSLSSASEKYLSFRWTNNSLRTQTTYWKSGEPNNMGSAEYCVHVEIIGNAILLNDYSCDGQFSFICQPKIKGSTSAVNCFQWDDLSILGYSIGGCFDNIYLVRSLISCASLCLKNTSCRSYYYNRGTRQCALVLFTDATADNYKQSDGWERYRGM